MATTNLIPVTTTATIRFAGGTSETSYTTAISGLNGSLDLSNNSADLVKLYNIISSAETCEVFSKDIYTTRVVRGANLSHVDE